MNKELISVIVSIYNEEKYVERCIKSIIRQSYEKLDIVLVDDGSVDDSAKICRRYTQMDKRINFICKENGGLVLSRKTGILSAKGDVVVFVDGDDWLEPDWIANLYDLMRNHNADMVIAGFKKDLNGSVKTYTNAIEPGVYERGEIENKIIPRMMYSGRFFECGIYTYLWNKMFRKNIVKPNQLRVKDEIFMGEDAACVYPSILQANKIVITEMVDYHYCIRPNSIVRKKVDMNDIKKLEIFYKYLRDIFSDHKFKDILLGQLFYFYAGFITLMSECLILEYPVLPKTYPFGHIEEGSKVAIYSAGAFGIRIHRQFINKTALEIEGWVDPYYHKYAEMNMTVDSVDMLKEKKVDYVIIASIDAGFVEDSIGILKQSGIDADRIITIQDHFNEIVSFGKKMISDMENNNER